MIELRLAHATVDALTSDHQQNLRKGRAFLLGATAPAEREACRVVLVHPTTGALLGLDAEIVWIKREEPGAGVGVELRNFDDAARERLRRFVEEALAPTEEAAEEAAPADAPEEPEPRGGPGNVYERVRGLSLRERESVARKGTLPERVALERCFGSSVWESLLGNPQLTPPEVMRIAKNGMLPRPLVQVIVANAAWLAAPELQRALLGNPRVSGPDLDRVLRAMSRPNLERIPALSSYRADVRQAAKRLLGR